MSEQTPAGYSDRLYNEDLGPLKKAELELVQHLCLLDVRCA